MSVLLAEDGAVLEHEDWLLAFADVFQVEERNWSEDGKRLFWRVWFGLCLACIFQKWVLPISSFQKCVSWTSSPWVPIIVFQRLLHHFPTKGGLFGAEAPCFYLRFLVLRTFPELIPPFLILQLLLLVLNVLPIQFFVNDIDIFYEVLDRLRQQFITLFQIVELLITACEIIIYYRTIDWFYNQNAFFLLIRQNVLGLLKNLHTFLNVSRLVIFWFHVVISHIRPHFW